MRTIRGPRSGLTLVEIMIATIVLVICIVPTIGLFNLGYESASFSEDRVYGETLASRILEVWNGRPFEELTQYIGKPVTDAVDRVYNTDKKEAWFDKLPEYGKNLGFKQGYFRGTLDVVEVTKGLLSLEVTVQWTVLEGGQKGETRQFKMLAFRAREDLSVATRTGDSMER